LRVRWWLTTLFIKISKQIKSGDASPLAPLAPPVIQIISQVRESQTDFHDGKIISTSYCGGSLSKLLQVQAGLERGGRASAGHLKRLYSSGGGLKSSWGLKAGRHAQDFISSLIRKE
jgi:hypothetical protein